MLENVAIYHSFIHATLSIHFQTSSFLRMVRWVLHEKIHEFYSKLFFPKKVQMSRF